MKLQKNETIFRVMSFDIQDHHMDIFVFSFPGIFFFVFYLVSEMKIREIRENE